MASDHVPITLRCPACETKLQLPTRTHHTGHGYAELLIDTTALREHVVSEHGQLPDRRCGCVGAVCCNCGDGPCSTS